MMGTAAFPAKRQEGVARARAEMFAAFVGELNRAEVPYCLLSGYENYPDASESDVDFMVGRQEVARVPGLLRAAARQSDALLVQAMQHETTAWYYVLGKQVGTRVAYLHPDCSTDYRRDGRLWLGEEDVLRRRRRVGQIFLAARADEFLYYMIKKVLKQEIDDAQLQRLRDLYVACPEECGARVRRFWSGERVSGVVSAVVSGNVWRLKWEMPALLRELELSARVECGCARAVQRAGEWRRRARRAIHPTGLVVSVSGGSAHQRDDFAAALQANLRPAFRRTTIIEATRIASPIRHRLAVARSTLVIRKIAAPSGIAFRRNQLCFELSEVPTDIVFATRMVLKSMAERV
jgi:hypothetical protein